VSDFFWNKINLLVNLNLFLFVSEFEQKLILKIQKSENVKKLVYS